jgi:hypothetical protein
MAQTVNVTGRRLTLARTGFTIAGFARVKGFWGLWELPNESGGFHIWPLGQDEGEQDYESAEEPAPLEAVAVET